MSHVRPITWIHLQNRALPNGTWHMFKRVRLFARQKHPMKSFRATLCLVLCCEIARFLIVVHWNTLWDDYWVSTNESNLPERGRCSLVLFMLMRTVVRIDDDLKLFQAFEGTFTTASHRDEFNFCCFGQAFWRVPVPVGPSRGCCIFMYWCILTVFLLYSYSILTFRNSGRWKIWWSLHECWVYALLKSLRFMNMQQLNSFWIPTWFYCWKK